MPPFPITIRPYTPDDYASIAEIGNAIYPQHPETADDLRHRDEKRPPQFLWARFVAENAGGQVVGSANYNQSAWGFHPHKFFVWVAVDPAFQRQGIGARLYDYLLADLERFEPVLLRTVTQEIQAGALAFLAAHGFAERTREWESRLDVAAFDPARFADAGEHVAAQGIVIKTVAEFASDADRDRQLYDLDAEVSLDIPSSQPASVPAYAEWRDRYFSDPTFLPDGVFVAVDTAAGNRYVGLSELRKRSVGDDLDTGTTGVLSAYRRRGIALALKLRAVAFAKERGTPTIHTENAQSNRAMLAINEALGFVKEPGWIEFDRALRPEPVVIRRTTPRDYVGIARVKTAVLPEFPVTESEVRARDEERDPKMRFDRFVIDEGGEIVAFGSYGQAPHAYHPRKFMLRISVVPACQGKGYGKALYEHLLAALRPFAPEKLLAETLADRERATRFLTDRGFAVVLRKQTSRLNPADFDPAGSPAVVPGVSICSFATLLEREGEAAYQRYDDLQWELTQDVPHSEPLTRPAHEQWMKRWSGDTIPEAHFVALDDATGDYVGAAMFWTIETNRDLFTGLTGVLPAYRRHGIATALKVAALVYAKARGAGTVWTSNDVGNAGMLAINQRLGFTPAPEELHWAKALSVL